MLENIKDIDAIRLEGNYEDIELKLNDGQYILAQAKSVVNSSSDFSHVRQNLEKALVSLSDGCQKADAKELILITNSPNPLNDDDSKSIFWGPAHRAFSSLPTTSRKIVTDYLDKLEHPLDTDRFSIQILPFETDDDAERYKVVTQAINDFIGTLNISIPGLGKRLLEVWHWDVFVNGSKKDTDIQLTKRNIVWPIMVIATDVERCDDAFLNQFDPALYDEIVSRYKEIIDTCCERIEFFTRILCDYNAFQSTKKPSEKCLDFVESTWENYHSEFEVDGLDIETQEALTKVVIYNIVHRRISIDRIKRGVNL